MTFSFNQPLLELLVQYVGVRESLNYASTCRSRALERKWLIENCAVVDHQRLADLRDRNMQPQCLSATIGSIKELQELPDTLTHLTFDDDFNQSLADVTLPPKITRLTFGLRFDQPLDCVHLPDTLTHLTFGDAFDQRLENATLPPMLTHLTFGYYFNRPLDRVVLPPMLTHLKFGERFDQSLDAVRFPSTLSLLTLHRKYNYNLLFVPLHSAILLYYDELNLFQWL